MSKKVALMCGHGKSTNGSWDAGCTWNGYNEAALMLPITKAAVKYLRSYGVTVISDADTGNNKNMIVDVAWANKEKADIYVSVHCDYSKAPTGVMPLYVSASGKKLATALNNAVKSGMGMKSRGVVKRTDLWELNGTDMPACILETGAIKADIKILKNKSDAYGKCIAKGICNYLGVSTTDKTSTSEAAKTAAKTTAVLYRVRKTWSDSKSQVGAYVSLDGAKKVADAKGLNVYDENGKLVYTGKKASTTTKTAAAASTAVTGNAAKIVAKAKEYAWPYGTKKAKYAYKTGKALSKYKAALKKQMGKKAKISQTDCGYFVSTCVRAAGLGKFTALGASGKKAYPKLMNKLKIVHSGKIGSFKLQPGDIIRYHKANGGQHTVIYLGDGKIAHASRGNAFPRIQKKHPWTASGRKDIQVLRAK